MIIYLAVNNIFILTFFKISLAIFMSTVFMYIRPGKYNREVFPTGMHPKIRCDPNITFATTRSIQANDVTKHQQTLNDEIYDEKEEFSRQAVMTSLHIASSLITFGRDHLNASLGLLLVFAGCISSLPIQSKS